MTKKAKKKNIKKSQKEKETDSRVVDLMDTDSERIITIYGEAGSGKTTFSSTAPKPIFYIDVKDKGTESLKFEGLKRGDVTVFRVSEFEDIYDAYDYLLEHLSDFKSVVIDHLTSLQNLCYISIMEGRKSKFMQMQWYGDSSSMMKEVFDLFASTVEEGLIPIFLAQQRVKEYDIGGEIGDDESELAPEISPDVQPAVAKHICAASRVVAQTHIQGKESKKGTKIDYRLRLAPSAYYITKVTRKQGNYLPDYLVNPTYEDLEKIITGKYEEKPEKKAKKKNKK